MTVLGVNDDMIFRYEVPVDGDWHEIDLAADPLHVGCRNPAVLEFWARAQPDLPTQRRWFTVVGTGYRMPSVVKYQGTAVDPSGQLVWHLVERLVDLDHLSDED